MRRSNASWSTDLDRPECRAIRRLREADLAELLDEQNEAVKWTIRTVDAAHRAGAKIGLCGQAPSDHPEFAEFLVECGIDSVP